MNKNIFQTPFLDPACLVTDAHFSLVPPRGTPCPLETRVALEKYSYSFAISYL